MAGRIGRRVYKSKRWKRVRWQVLHRDGFRCTACGKAGRLEVDHIRRIEDGGDWYDLDNLKTVCRGCHLQKTADENRKPPDPARAELMAMAMGGAGA